MAMRRLIRICSIWSEYRLLGETVPVENADDLKAISEKLEIINLQLAGRRGSKRKTLHWIFIGLCVLIVLIAAELIITGSPYLTWDYGDPERAVMGTVLHTIEWTFFRAAPIVFIGSAAGAILTRKKS